MTLLMSGGMDSMVCAHLFVEQGLNVLGLFIDFGQAPVHRERSSVKQVCRRLSIALSEITVSGTRRFGSGEITGRNAFLIFTALLARKNLPGLVSLGIHAGTRYFDCSPVFAQSVGRLVDEHTDGRVKLAVPLISWTKKDIFDYAVRHELPIANTYSCEKGGAKPCGRCLSCRDRKALEC